MPKNAPQTIPHARLFQATLVLAMLAAAGCAQEAPRPANATTKFDGSYSGSYQLTSGKECNTDPKPAQMTVSNGKMSLTYSPRGNVYFTQWVSDDGAVAAGSSAKGYEIDLKGQFAGDGFTGTTANVNCTYSVVMKKS